MPGSRGGGQVGGPSVEAFVGQDGEGDGFFRVAVDAELGGRPKPRGVERVLQPPSGPRPTPDTWCALTGKLVPVDALVLFAIMLNEK